jgi:hypothetical protein
VHGDDQAGGVQPVAVCLHVHRRHGHDRDHDQLAEDHGGGARRDAAGEPSGAARLRAFPFGWRGGQRAGDEKRIGPQQDEQDRAGNAVGQAGEGEWACQSGDARLFRHVAADRDRANGGGDEHGADGTAAPVRSDQVRAGIVGLQVGGGAGTVDEQRHQQQRDVVKSGREHDPGAADGTGGISGGEAGAAAEALGQAPDGQGGAGGPECEQGGG